MITRPEEYYSDPWVLLTVARRCLCSRNLNNEEAMARVRSQRQSEVENSGWNEVDSLVSGSENRAGRRPNWVRIPLTS